MVESYINPEYVSGALYIEVQRRLYNRELKEKPEKQITGLVDMDFAGEVRSFIMPSTLAALADHSDGGDVKTITRAEALRIYNRLRNDFLPTSAEGSYMRANITSSIAYVRAYQEGMPPTRQYLADTLGIREGALGAPNEIPQEQIRAQLARAASRFNDLGHDFTRSGVAKYVDETKINEADAVEKFMETDEKLKPIIRRAYGIFEDPEYRLETARVLGNWGFYTDHDQQGYRIRLNVHPSQIERQRLGEYERVYSHEYGVHVILASQWEKQIAAGNLNPGVGVIRTPDAQCHYEGLGNALVFFVPELYNALSPQGQFEAENRLAETEVMGNAYLYATNLVPFESQGTITEYVLDQLPTYSRERVHREINGVLTSPHHRPYRYAYGQPSYDYWQIAQNLSDPERILFLREVLAKPMTPGQVTDLANNMESVKTAGGLTKKVA